MKKLALLMLILILLLCGCNAANTVTPVTKGIELTLNINCGETKYNVSALIDNGGCMTATVNSPDVIKGMKITSNKFETLAEYRNLKYSYNEDEFIGNNYIVTTYNVLSSLDGRPLPFKKGENCVLSGEYLGEKYDFSFSPAGLPIMLNISSKNIEVVFSNIRLL